MIPLYRGSGLRETSDAKGWDEYSGITATPTPDVLDRREGCIPGPRLTITPLSSTGLVTRLSIAALCLQLHSMLRRSATLASNHTNRGGYGRDRMITRRGIAQQPHHLIAANRRINSTEPRVAGVAFGGEHFVDTQ